MTLPATKRPPKDFKELQWQEQMSQEGTKSSSYHTEEKSSDKKARKTIMLPFYGGGSSVNYSRYVEVDAEGRLGTMTGHMKVKKAKPIIPGWLVELKDYYLRGVMDIKTILGDENQNVSIRSVVLSLGKVIREDMEMNTITDAEIFNVLKWIPMDCQGNFSFPHFMFGMGNRSMALKSGIFMLNERKFGSKVEAMYSEEDKDKKRTEDQSGGDQERGENLSKSDNVKNEERPANNPNTPDETGYNLREKLFFSGLLIFEMYETLKEVESLYASIKIPEPASMTMKRDRRRGFGIENIGYKKHKEASWDKPPAPIPKLSPYLSTVPFVTAKWITYKPGSNAKLKRTYSKLQPLHLAIRPPREHRHTICITENQTRVRQALAYLASKGDCVALLPDIHFVIHLSDTDVDKLEVVTIRESPYDHPPVKVNQFEEKRLIIQELKNLYQPLILPLQITKLDSKITYADGLQLREICKHLQREHWNHISLKKLDFREKVWVRMHVDDMPLGRLRDSFIYAFVTYLPFVSHLPIVCGKNCLI